MLHINFVGKDICLSLYSTSINQTKTIVYLNVQFHDLFQVPVMNDDTIPFGEEDELQSGVLP